jgi:hypothetical protein
MLKYTFRVAALRLKYTFEGVESGEIEGPVVLDLRESFGPLAGVNKATSAREVTY